MHHLENMLGLGQAAQLVRPEIHEVDARTADELVGHQRDQDLTTVSY